MRSVSEAPLESEAGSKRLGTAVWWICFSIALIDGYDTLLMSFLAPVISRDLGTAPDLFRGVFTATYAGATVGAVLLGSAADRYGRRPLLLLSLALIGIFTVSAAWVHTLNELMWARAAAGIGLGGAIPIISAIAAGGVAQERRREAVTRVFIGYPIGAIVGGLLTASTMTHVDWRSLMVATGLVPFLLLPVTYWRPREPESASARTQIAQRGNPLPQLFAEERAFLSFTLCVCVFLVLGVSYFLVSWIPTVLTLNGLSASRAAAIAVLLNVGGLAGAWVLSVAGRVAPARFVGASLCIGAVLVGLFGIALGRSQITAAGAVFVIGFLVIGAQTNIPALCAWLYPLRLSASGVGLAMACGRLGSIAGPLIGGYLLARHLGWPSLFLAAAVPILLAGAGLIILAVRDRARQ